MTTEPGLDVLHLIDRLEGMVAQGFRLRPLRRVMMDEDRLLELIDEIRLAIPHDIKEAGEILERRDEVLHEAREEAHRIRTRAEDDFVRRVSETEVLLEATERARQTVVDSQNEAHRMLEDADREAEQRRRGADEYAAGVLRHLDGELVDLSEEIAKALGALERRDRRNQQASHRPIR